MGLITFWNKKIKTLDWADIGLIKVSGALFILMVAKLLTPLLNLRKYDKKVREHFLQTLVKSIKKNVL